MKNIFITQRITHIKKYGEMRDCIDQNMISWVVNLNMNPILVPNNLIKKKGELDKFIKNNKPHGLILTGGDDIGKFLIRDKTENYLLNFFISKNKPIFGICRGMQIINKKFNGNLFKQKGHVAVRHKIDNKTVKKGFPKYINSYHNYVIRNLPQNFISLVTLKDASIEYFRHKKMRIEACMWHPEREKNFSKIFVKRVKNFFG